MPNTNSAFLTSMTVVAIGYAIKRRRIVPEESGKILSRIVLYVTFPALIFHTFSRIHIEPSLFFLPLICLGYGALALVFALRLFKNKPDALKGLLVMAVVGFNMGLFAFPLIEGVWGLKGLQYAAMFDIGNAFIVLGLSYVTGSIYSPRRNPEQVITVGFVLGRLLRSFPLQLYVLTLIINLTGIQLPALFSELIGVLARANMALVLLLLGIYLDFNFNPSLVVNVLRVMMIRYGLGLLAGALFFWLLPFDLTYRSIVLIGLILPVGVTILPFSDEFGYDHKLAGMLATITIVSSFGLMWLLITVLRLA
jgi:predicted permease